MPEKLKIPVGISFYPLQGGGLGVGVSFTNYDLQ